MSALFTPFTLKDVTLRNRIAVPPMCQYTANDGFVNEWHQTHYAGMARGGAGLVIVEATAVSPEGRITPGCAGLWNDAQVEGMAHIATRIKAAGAVAGIQSLGQFDRLAMEAGPVVRTGLEGLGKNRAVVIPGATNKVGALSTRFAPRSFVRKIAGSLKF